MSSGIYVIEDRETKECLYVGQSKDLAMRQRKHLQKLKNGSHPRKDFVEWFKLNGEDRLQFHIVETELKTDDELNLSEIWWFNKLSPRFYGKQPSLNEAWSHSLETRSKISQALKGRKVQGSGFTHTCPVCYTEFASSKSVRTFCSVDCRIKSNRTPGAKEKPSRDELEMLYLVEGKSLTQLEKVYLTSRTTIQRWCKEYNINKNAAVA